MKSHLESLLESKSNSKLREQLIEYKFLTEILEYSSSISKKLEISRLEHDSFGYDIILKVDDTIRYIQLKSRIKDGSAKTWDIHKSLLKNEDGTVVLILINYHQSHISLDYFVLNEINRERVLNHTPRKSTADKSKFCKIILGDFVQTSGISELFHYLFPKQTVLSKRVY